MPDLSFDEVRVLAKASSLEVSEEDLVEVTHRLNVIISGIENFSHPDLDKVDPVPFRPLDEIDS
tara:strand:+ start:762 stop:953 length:192 start_codon:yes stop_codon:yes gene_type:complete